MQEACRSIMQHGLMQSLQLHSSSQQTAGSKRVAKAIKAAAKGLYGLFESLENVMAADSYLQVCQPDRLWRKA